MLLSRLRVGFLGRDPWSFRADYRLEVPMLVLLSGWKGVTENLDFLTDCILTFFRRLYNMEAIRF